MTDIRSSGNYLGLVARSVAELVDQLRLSAGEPSADALPPAGTSRLRVAARLLPLTGDTSCARLGRALEQLVEELANSPGRDLSALEPALEVLAQAVEELFAGLDAGRDAMVLGDDPVWLGVLSRLAVAGSALEVMEDLDRCARQWEVRWADRQLPAEVEEQLQRRWSTYREYGNAVFGGAVADPGPRRSPEETVPREMVVLLESRMRLEQLQDRLRQWGYELLVAADARQAVALAGRRPAACRAILCDQMVPGRNLGALLRLRQEVQDPLPPLVLVTSGSGDSRADLQRARAMGADLVWTEPFAADPLPD